jgi:hypothetical protein
MLIPGNLYCKYLSELVVECITRNSNGVSFPVFLLFVVFKVQVSEHYILPSFSSWNTAYCAACGLKFKVIKHNVIDYCLLGCDAV